MVNENYTQKDGRRLFEEDKLRALADPEFRAIYEAESSKKRTVASIGKGTQMELINLSNYETLRRITSSQLPGTLSRAGVMTRSHCGRIAVLSSVSGSARVCWSREVRPT